MSAIQNAEAVRKRHVVVYPASKLAVNVLKVLQGHGYVGEIEIIEDGRGDKLRVELLGRINRCGAIRPRFPVKSAEILDFARKYLPSRDLGILVVSTPKGLKTHLECLDENTGGVLLAYVY
jgi:small subunit ribosomal protein S8